MMITSGLAGMIILAFVLEALQSTTPENGREKKKRASWFWFAWTLPWLIAIAVGTGWLILELLLATAAIVFMIGYVAKSKANVREFFCYVGITTVLGSFIFECLLPRGDLW